MDFSHLKNKKVLLGITGSIATYKAPQLVRELIKAGANVRVVATPSAEKFVSFSVLENLTQNILISDIFDSRNQSVGAWHIELAHWCDVYLIAPCSATSLSKIANGNCDNALSCVAIALPNSIPLVISPAMDYTMYMNPATQKNINTLIEYGAKIILPDEGELASGLVGPGRLPEFNTILSATNEVLSGSSKSIFNDDSADSLLNDTILGNISGKRIMISAGSTIEKIDAVRFISNYSTGKMGYALAEVASRNGALVTLISGATSLKRPNVDKFISVKSAEEMFVACTNNFAECDIAIMAAAVADFTPEIQVSGKIKKQDVGDNYCIKLKKTKDILKTLGERKENQFLIGFALETENEIENAKEKLNKKNCDMIVVNSANKKDSGFEGDNNTISILKKNDEKVYDFPVATKIQCAKWIFETI
ncbi:MAG: bifunctional phosphopantothenoylcysteine decarboxylase/phosphopantothenate--cysteine ligase CoaBC [Ignavibacteria bacterium]|jgi:phosphopantothenoylcysteine decarboxylase/phosphopantothenate--cysteine ligase|nr:bifunctional phosphopantothenoylcysteine decarboxylase/phosphopantothenate--cysteine ligase CoaBC [Ignavibacteria bacterium]